MAKVRRVPARTCVACGQTRAKRELIRIVRTALGGVQVDPSGKVSGRGAYVCPKAECVETAWQEHRLEHALAVPVPVALVDDLRRATAAAAMGAAEAARPRVIGPIPLEKLGRRSGR